MAEAFVQVLLDNLSSLIKEEIGTIMGVDNEMKKLSSTLTTIQAVLEDAEEKQLESRSIRNWLCKLNDLTYKIDDILDECSTEIEKLQHKSSKSGLHGLKNILYKHKIGRRMKAVAKELDDVAAERSKFHLCEMDVERRGKVAFTRETGSLLNELDHVYGRDEDKEKIVDILVNQVRERQQLTVLPIVGMGGLGKTTLAQLVFNDHRVAMHFDAKLWVCVSDYFDIKTLIKAMLESATGSGNALNLMCMDTLQRRLRELLNAKRYLIVLDDVWNEDQEQWSELRNTLACGSSGASIIVTTRLKIVADIMSTFTPYDLTELSNEDCWNLFKQRAFGQEEEQYTNLEVIGKQIVKKCGGVPLAAKTLGGLLRFKREEKEWIRVKESEIWNLPQEKTSIMPALRLSYHHLPLSLRQCFAYCAVFPKDYEFEKEELIFQWMAHGYITSSGKLEVEDVGNEIWKELVLRSLFQDVERDIIGKTTFKMHDLVHDLAQSIMENKVPGAQTESNTKSPSISKIRQVNLHNRSMSFPTNFLPDVDLSVVINKFGHLRSLNASVSAVEDVPSTIGNLKHLRYLNLSLAQIRMLPKTICSLWNLKVLNLNYCFKLVRLPENMRYMYNLRHVYLDGCSSLSEMPSRIGELTFLRTLSMFIVGYGKGNQLEELQSLNLGGSLRIKHLERVENHKDAKKANIAQKKNLRRLKLEWTADLPSKLGENEDEKILEALEPPPSVEFLQIQGFKGRNFPPWMGISTLENIVDIEIFDCPNCLWLPRVLGELTHLKVLSLRHLKVLEYIIQDEVASVDSMKQIFPSLEKLYLWSLPNLKGLLKEEMTEIQMFPNLQSSEIWQCPSFVLPQLSSLEELILLSCDNMTLTSIPKLENLNRLVIYTHGQMTPVPVKGFKNLAKLKSLIIDGAEELCLPEEELGILKSLTDVRILGSKTQRCLPDRWLSHLTAVEKLYIGYCPEFMEFPQGMKYLQNLTSITLATLPKMMHLPEALQCLHSLRSLTLSSLTQLASLPDWFGNFTNLNSLDIHFCPNLVSLPEAIQEMGSIERLTIFYCPELERRCEKEKGEDWPKIKHIPVLRIEENPWSLTCI